MHRRHSRNAPGRQVINPYSRMVARFAYTQDSERWTEWSFRLISQRQALRQYADGQVERIEREKDGVVQVVGYRELKAARAGAPTACSLTLASMEALRRQAYPHKKPLTYRECAEVVRIRIWPLMRPTMSLSDWAQVESAVGTL